MNWPCSAKSARQHAPAETLCVERQLTLSDSEFSLFQKMIYDVAGIHLTDVKKTLVSGRLAKRVKHLGLDSYGDYFQLLRKPGSNELQIAVDLLTTNETFFFREKKHFDFLRDKVLPDWDGRMRRLWSAASSSGEEAYTLAMVMAEHARHDSWEIVGTDISSRVVEKAQRGHYPLERADNIPRHLLSRYCLKGVGSQEGTFIINDGLRSRTRFCHANLKADLTSLGSFDVIFLRNVMIYFDMPTKQQIVARLIMQLKPGGYMMVGHSESLNGVSRALTPVAPSIYRKSQH